MTASLRRLYKFYETMLLIRRFEEASAKAYAEGKIKGFCHLYIGQESVAVGAIGTLDAIDYVIATYREHGHAIARGVPINPIMAELFGKESGVSKGLGGSMHLFDIQRRFMGGHGIVGGHVSVATGLAFGSKYKKERAAVLCFIGEGAVTIGGFHEGLSLASLWKLPVVFIVENNLYSMGTPSYRHLAVPDITQRAQGYGMPGKRIEGADVMVVYDTIKDAVNRARSDEGPSLIEVITYRYRGHSMSDPAKYRPEGELEEKKENDPLLVSATQLKEAGIRESELNELDKKIKKDVQKSVDFADASDFPPVSTLHRFTYSNPL